VPEPLRFVVPPPTGFLLPRSTMGLPIAVAPDGRRVAFLAGAGGVPSVWLWSAEDGETRRLEGTEGAMSPFFSPDGREIAFFAADELRRIGVAGGLATRIARTPSGNCGTWGGEGTILFTRWLGPEAGLYSVLAGGGEPRRLVPAPRLADLRSYPSLLPDGRHYLFTNGAMGGRVGDRRACVASIGGGEPDCVATCDSQATYSGTGHIVCVRRGTLVAQPFDARTLRTTGEAIALAPDVRWFGPPGTASFAVTANGRLLVYEPAPPASRLAWLDRSGREVGRLGEAARYGEIELTRDGRRLAVEMWSQETGSRDLWSLDVASGVPTRLTFDPVEAASPAWSPDAGRVAFARVAGAPPDVAVRTLDGGRVDTILEVPGVQDPRHWSPDGRLIAYEDYLTSRRDSRQVWLLSLDGRHRRFHEIPANVYNPRFSPDSRTLAFVSEESGAPEVYVARVDGTGLVRRLSRTGGLLPRWRADGGELFFFQPDGMMVSVDPRAEGVPPRLLFHVDGVVGFDFDYDISPDGQRFLVRLSPQPEGSVGLRLALHWAQGPKP
jgi:Tol biopolymer transport system component